MRVGGAMAWNNQTNYLTKQAQLFNNLFMGLNCLLYTSDAADERSSVDLGGRRIIKTKNNRTKTRSPSINIHS